MGITGDLLTAITPTRLVCRRGSWSLEVERLVAVERDVYQPRTQRLEGTDAVLQHLQRTANTALAHAAHALIRGNQAAEECAFEALDSEWVACEATARRESSRPGALAAANASALELRAELCLLRATHAGLRERLARLESQLASQTRARELRAPESLASIRPPQSRVAAPLSRPSPNVPAAVPIADAPASSPPPGSASPSPSTPLISTPSISVPASLAPPAARALIPLKLPSASAVAVCLKTLIGRKIGLQEVRPGSFPAKGKKRPYWFSRLIDDDGNDVGALVTDLMAAIGLGGALMMIPPQELDAQRAAQTPSEDVMSAVAEVMNNLSATINQMPEGPHVRVQPLEAMTDANLAWTKAAAHAMDLELDDGMGHLLLFAR
jgi:hypothetical protein